MDSIDLLMRLSDLRFKWEGLSITAWERGKFNVSSTIDPLIAELENLIESFPLTTADAREILRRKNLQENQNEAI